MALNTITHILAFYEDHYIFQMAMTSWYQILLKWQFWLFVLIVMVIDKQSLHFQIVVMDIHVPWNTLISCKRYMSFFLISPSVMFPFTKLKLIISTWYIEFVKLHVHNCWFNSVSVLHKQNVRTKSICTLFLTI